jgi:hypothetical protein
MSEPWIRECNEFLKQVRESMTLEDADRLALVRSINRALHAVNHSILGWFQYVNNPDIMSRFDREELNEISDALNKFAESFIEHDIEVTKKSMEKGLSEPEQEEQERASFYI